MLSAVDIGSNHVRDNPSVWIVPDMMPSISVYRKEHLGFRVMLTNPEDAPSRRGNLQRLPIFKMTEGFFDLHIWKLCLCFIFKNL